MMSQSGTGRPMTQEDIDRWVVDWAANMVNYWHERMLRLRIVNTGALYSSLRERVDNGGVTTIEHTFLKYGLYVATGVGPAHMWKYWSKAHNHPKTERKRTEGGHLEFLDSAYRSAHGLDQRKSVGPQWGGKQFGGKPKGKRDWFFKKYLASLYVLGEKNQAFYGEAYKGLMLSTVEEVFKRANGHL